MAEPPLVVWLSRWESPRIYYAQMAIDDAIERGWRERPRLYPGHQLLDDVRMIQAMLRRKANGASAYGGTLKHEPSADGRGHDFYIDGAFVITQEEPHAPAP